MALDRGFVLRGRAVRAALDAEVQRRRDAERGMALSRSSLARMLLLKALADCQKKRGQ